jgi:DNA-directed RNA polymerase subunit RPC12/RpoP
MNRAEMRAQRRVQAERAAKFLTGDETLRCPRCGGDYLHQGRVEVFHRPAEDAPYRGVTVDRGLPIADLSAANPSERRQGLLIFFQCEYCDLESWDLPLALYQHKGRTFVEWRWVVPVGGEGLV